MKKIVLSAVRTGVLMPSDLKVEVSCTICKKTLLLTILDEYFNRVTKYPVTFQYKHGFPIHTALITFDVNRKIIKTEFSELHRKMQPSGKVSIKEYIRGLSFKSFKEIEGVFNKILKEMPSDTVNPSDKFIDEKYYEWGVDLGDLFFRHVDGKNEQEILENFGKILKPAKLGEISAIIVSNQTIQFHILNLFEHSKLQDAGKSTASFFEGFFKSIFQRKFNRSFLIKSSFNSDYKSCELQLQSQWSDFAERLRAKFAKSSAVV